MQPGDTINPGGAPGEEPKEPEVAQTTPQADVPAPEPNDAGPEAPDSQWQFKQEEEAAIQSTPPLAQHDPVTWTASEYIAHDKGASWYVILGIAVILFAGIVYVLTQELLSSIVILIMGAAFGAFAARKPQELTYVLDNSALQVGNRTYSYAQFKSFTVIDEGPISSIMLMPLQRFMPPLSVYYDPADEEKIANALQSYLPYEDRKQDYIDKFMRKVRF